MNLNGTTALVTGGSRGLGKALGRTLASKGSRVILVAREPVALASAVEQIRTEGGSAWGIAADVGDPAAAASISARAVALAGPVDILVNNASTLGPTPLPPLLDTRSDDLSRVFEVNLLGPFRLMRSVVGSMALRRRGVVVSISSDAAVEAYSGWGGYGSSKAALDHLTRIWAAEVASTGVRMFAVDPGEMDTAMHAAAIPDADPSTLQRPAEVAERIAALIASDATGVRVAA